MRTLKTYSLSNFQVCSVALWTVGTVLTSLGLTYSIVSMHQCLYPFLHEWTLSLLLWLDCCECAAVNEWAFSCTLDKCMKVELLDRMVVVFFFNFLRNFHPIFHSDCIKESLYLKISPKNFFLFRQGWKLLFYLIFMWFCSLVESKLK